MPDNNLPFIRRVLFIVGVFLIIVGIFLYLLFSPLSNIPIGKIFKVAKGESLSQVASELRTGGFIRSSSLFKLVVVLMGHAKDLKSGEYIFSSPVSLVEVGRRISNGISGIEVRKITIPEGYNLHDIAHIFENSGIMNAKSLWRETGEPGIDYRANKTALASRDFSQLSELVAQKPKYVSLEGYLFPETYFFQINDTPETITEKMIKMFDSKIIPEIRDEAIQEGKSFHQIFTMASILEEEAKTDSDRKIVSGILWKRLDVDIPLQVDSTVAYVVGHSSKNLTFGDLAFDSSYNTYKYRGLPPGGRGLGG